MDWRHFILAFVPLFVAVDPIGMLPLFMSLTEGMPLDQRRRVIRQAVLTALATAVAFVIVGKSVFRLLGITVADFMVAGGVLLFIIAALDLLSGTKAARRMQEVGAVPLGVPLMVGPAVLTSTLMLVDMHGIAATLAALVANIAVTGGVLLSAHFWMGLLGRSGSRTVSKVASLLLAAIAVMMIRRGVSEILGLG